jgi:signal peptide peptidase SppA
MSDRQRYRNIMSAAFGSVWAIMPEKLRAIEEFLYLKASGVNFTQDEIEMRAGDKRSRRLNQVNGTVAVLPLYGVISQKMNMLTEISGGTSTEMFGMAFDDAMANKDIKAIVFDIDSPGGTVAGTPELALKILSARGEGKQIVAVSNSLAASAAYWIGSAADQFVITPSGEAGSIGVYAMHIDYSKQNAMLGAEPSYISAGKYKIEGHPDAPLTAEARNTIQASVDEAYGMFVDAVAIQRHTTSYRVRNGYGEGRVLSAQRAVEEGLADRVASFEKVMGELGVGRVSGGSRAETEGVDLHVEAADEGDEPEDSDDLDMRRRRWRHTKGKVGL